MRKTVAILGIPIDDLNMDQTLERLDQFVRSRRFHQVATANTDFLVKALQDTELRAALLTADMVVPDGMPLVAASKLLGAPLRERVTGADMVPRLAELGASQGYRLFMLGARPEVAEEARRRLEQEYPGLQVVGCVSPPAASIVEMDNEGILAQIELARPDILLVAFGNPKQEKWIYMHRDRLTVPVCIGVGATFDFIAGASLRAPIWVQRVGLEWSFRLFLEPRRLWRRYAQDLVHFGRFILVQVWVMRRGRSPALARIMDVRLGEWTIISVSGPLNAALLPELQEAAERALNAPSHLVLDLLAATHIDSVVLGTLLNLPKRAGHVGRELRLVGVHGRVKQALSAMGLERQLHVYGSFAEAVVSAEEAVSDRAVVRSAESELGVV